MTVDAHAQLRELLAGARRAGGGRRASSSGCGRSRTPGRSSGSRAATKLADEAFEAAARGRAGGAHRARARARARADDAPARRRAAELRPDRRRGSARRAAACAAARRGDRARPAGRDRLGRQARRLLLGLHAHGRRRRAGDAEAREAYELVLDAQLAGLDEVRAGGRRHGVDAVARDMIDGRRPRRALRPRPRPRRRARDPRGAAALVSVDDDAAGRQRRHRRAGRLPPGRFGVRIEDLVVVTDDGREILTSIPKELTVVD